MIHKTEFKIPNNIYITINGIIIKNIDVENIKHVDIYIDNEKMRAYYKPNEMNYFDYSMYVDNGQLVKIVIETKDDKQLKIDIVSDFIFIQGNDILNENDEQTFCYIVGNICDRKKCDVYPCDGSTNFYNITLKNISRFK